MAVGRRAVAAGARRDDFDRLSGTQSARTVDEGLRFIAKAEGAAPAGVAGEVLYPSQGLFYFKVADTLLMSAIFSRVQRLARQLLLHGSRRSRISLALPHFGA